MMSTQKKQDIEPDFGHFAPDSLVGLALRGLLEPVPAEDTGDLPKLSEMAILQADGKIAVYFVSYDHPRGSDRSWGDYICSPGSPEYRQIIERHGQLQAGQISQFTLYHDDRIERK